MKQDSQTIGVVLVEDNAVERRHLSECISTDPRFHLVGVTGSANEAFTMIEKNAPQAVILDLELDEGDGLDLLCSLKCRLPEMPYVIVTTKTTSPVTLQAVRDNGADFIFTKSLKGYSAKQVVAFLHRISKFLVHTAEEEESPEETPVLNSGLILGEELYRHTIVLRLKKMGMRTSLTGFHYLVDSIALILSSERSISSLIKEVYPLVAEKWHTVPANVERNIRSAIETTWEHTSPYTLQLYYTGYVDPERGKPTNKEFIFSIVKDLEN